MFDAEVERLNKLLADRYGKNLADQPHFRIVWSEDIFEIRVGQFSEYYRNIFLRSYYGAKNCRKYNYIKDRWILEMWHLTSPIKEIPDPDGYEPIFVFESNKGNPLPPIWLACEYACQSVLNPVHDPVQRKQATEEFINKQEEKEKEYFYDMFDLTPIQSLLHSREAISMKEKVN